MSIEQLVAQAGTEIYDEVSALTVRINTAVDRIPWLALRPTDYSTSELARKYLRLATVLLELLEPRP